MKSAAAVPIIARLREGMPEAVVAWGRAWGLGSMVAVLMTLSLVLLAEGRPGDLDPTFGVRGKVTTDFGGPIDVAIALVLQPDGKLVAAGSSSDITNPANEVSDFALARYLPDGRLDPAFGTGGRVTTDFGGVERAEALILQPDGKLVLAGTSIDTTDTTIQVSNFLARYLPDGRLDPTFGVGGQVITDVDATALVLQPDGKLVAAGGSGDDFALARYLPDGRLDLTFGAGGQVTTDFGGFDQAFALVLQPDGKLVAAGISSRNGIDDFALARYLPDGRLDPTFGIEGQVITDFGGADQADALVLQPDGKLVAAGFSLQRRPAGDDFDFALARYLPDGRLDAAFGVGGQVTTDFGGAEHATALVLQPDGKLVAAGGSNPPEAGTADFALARYRPDGRLDATFGVGGQVTTDFGGADFATALVLQPDGKLVAAGFLETRTPDDDITSDFALARYVEQQRVFNDFMTFEPLPATFLFTPDPTGCPEGFVGTFRFEARLTNISEHSLSALVVEVTALTGGNLLQNADGGSEGVGARLTVPRQEGFRDGILTPDEFVDVPFLICLQQQEPFRLVVDVFGEAE